MGDPLTMWPEHPIVSCQLSEHYVIKSDDCNSKPSWDGTGTFKTRPEQAWKSQTDRTSRPYGLVTIFSLEPLPPLTAVPPGGLLMASCGGGESLGLLYGQVSTIDW